MDRPSKPVAAAAVLVPFSVMPFSVITVERSTFPAAAGGKLWTLLVAVADEASKAVLRGVGTLAIIPDDAKREEPMVDLNVDEKSPDDVRRAVVVVVDNGSPAAADVRRV